MNRPRTVLLTLLLLLSGCATRGHRTAYLECACPRGGPTNWEVAFTAPTGRWKPQGHGFGTYEEIRTYAMHLPERPVPNSTFIAAQVLLFDTSGAVKVPVLLTGGSVALNTDKRELILSLQTPDGEFWANGNYPLDKNAF